MDECYEFVHPGWLARVRSTPLRDALRWDWSGQLDPRVLIAAAELPAPIPGLIFRVVHGTRLWRREQLDVARELVAHFGDGLMAGRSPQELVRDFGSAPQASRLIRQAKRRNRPAWWQCWHVLFRTVAIAVGLGIVAYMLLSVRFFWGRPDVARNYCDEINAARHVDENDRAWPIYREALLKLGREDAGWVDADKVANGPNGKHWAAAVELLRRHPDVLELVRQGAAKKSLGYYLGDRADLNAVGAAGEWLISKHMPVAADNPEINSVHLAGTQGCRTIARLLALDARVAAFTGDGARVVADIAALLSLSEQQFEPRATLVEQLVGLAIFGQAIDTIGRVLADTPAVLTEEQLRELAHRTAAYRNGQMSIDFAFEQMLFDDILQRAYTDDGHGNGRITPTGLVVLANDIDERQFSVFHLLDSPTSDERLATLGVRMLSPAMACFIGSRQENQRLYRELMDEMIAVHQGVPWHWDTKAIDAYDNRLNQMAPGNLRFRYCFVSLLMPSIGAALNAAERSTQIRDAAEVAIALELWHHRHGQWPDKLDRLVPALLPAVPPDRVDGQPIRYVVRDGRPVVYSLGRDRRDDGGRPSENPEDAIENQYGPIKPNSRTSAPAGDWILWPPVPVAVEDDES